MAHTVIKFICNYDEDCMEFFKKDPVTGESLEPIGYDDVKSWHLVSIGGDGESTVCGQIYSEYDRNSKTVQKGGITCEDCLEEINYLKSIKL